MDLCKCGDLRMLRNNNRDLFIWDKKYGWMLKWIELTDEPGYTQAHRYAISISFCPFCGKKIKK